MSEETEIRAALGIHAAFYTALAEGDWDAMNELWASTGPVICTHPGATPILGREAVMASWRQILLEPPAIEARDAQVAMIRGLAFITCTEQIGEVRLAATKVLVWEDGGWRVALHQAGHCADPIRESTPSSGPLH